MKWMKKNWVLITKIIILISCILTPTFLLIPPGKPKIIASLISLNLNGEINGNLHAQLLIENLTTLELEENKELISLIETDIFLLTNQIQGLESIAIYNYSFSPSPGSINIFLENVRYNEKKFLREINSIVDANKTKWWYVEEFVFTPIVKEGETRDEAYTLPACQNHVFFNPYFYEPPQNYGDTVILLSNETITASWWIIQNSNWTFNDEFYQIILSEIISFQDKIVGIEEISIPYLRMNETEFNLNHPILYNLTEPIPEDYARLLGEAMIRIDFTSSITRTERNTVKKVFEKILLSKWYIPSYDAYICDFGEGFLRSFIGIFVATPICVLIGGITLILLIRNPRRK